MAPFDWRAPQPRHASANNLLRARRWARLRSLRRGHASARIRSSFPGVDLTEIPMSAAVKNEKLIYLLDPARASRRSFAFKIADRVLRSLSLVSGLKHDACELPYTPPFMRKHDGLVLSLGQFNQWVSDQVAASGMVQIWPGMPVAEP